MNKDRKLRILVECAVMLALHMVLGLLTLLKMPNGGSVTVASMVPLVFIALKYGTKWGLLTAFAAALTQMLLGFSAPPTQTLGYFALVVLLDYVVAFTVIGLANLFAQPFKNKSLGVAVACVGVSALRFFCHFLSGILIWDVYAPPGIPVWLFSLQYNGSFMLPEAIITAVCCVMLYNRLIIKKKTLA